MRRGRKSGSGGMVPAQGARKGKTDEPPAEKPEAPETPETPKDEERDLEPEEPEAPPMSLRVAPDPDPEPVDLVAFLRRVVPDEDRVTFLDIAGREHETVVMLSARRQFQIARLWRRVYDMLKPEDVEEARESGDQFQEVLLNLLSNIVADEPEVEDVLYETFRLIHRKAIRGAQRGPAGEMAAAIEGHWLEDDGEEAADPQSMPAEELFPAEEMIVSIIPFSLRIARRVARSLGT